MVGTREHNFSLKDLSTEAGAGAAALAAAVGKGKGRDGEDGDDLASVNCDAEAARLALDDGGSVVLFYLRALKYYAFDSVARGG